MPDKKIEVIPAFLEPVRGKGIGWVVHETVGIAIINGLLLLPREERERKLAEPAVPGAPYVCPNKCDGPFRTHGRQCTLVGWVEGLDPNHWTEACSCEACGARFLKEWVWAKDYGRPWSSVYMDGRLCCYHGKPTCCEANYTMGFPR
jgi:hypothetical protein